jgi:septum formation protein
VNAPPLILASLSPRRSELLRPLGLPFTVVPSNRPELHGTHLTVRELAMVNAHRKARAVAKEHPDALVLGADTLVSLGTSLFGKPKDLTEAKTMLGTLAGRTHQVVTGVALIHLRQQRERLFTETTDVRFRDLTGSEIDAYLEQIQPLDKAGAYAIQEYGELLVESISGSRTNVIGLPMERLQAELSSWSCVGALAPRHRPGHAPRRG